MKVTHFPGQQTPLLSFETTTTTTTYNAAMLTICQALF